MRKGRFIVACGVVALVISVPIVVIVREVAGFVEPFIETVRYGVVGVGLMLLGAG